MLFEKIEFEEGEEVIQLVRKHWFVLFAELIGVIFMALLPFIITALVEIFPQIIPGSINLFDYAALITYLTSLWLLFTVLAAFMIWTHYYLDLWIITDRRIILVDQIQFFNRKVSIFRLERLQDIRVTINGIIPTLLNFGTIQAQTAGDSNSDFISVGLPDPRELQSLIQKATDARLEHLNNIRL